MSTNTGDGGYTRDQGRNKVCDFLPHLCCRYFRLKHWIYLHRNKAASKNSRLVLLNHPFSKLREVSVLPEFSLSSSNVQRRSVCLAWSPVCSGKHVTEFRSPQGLCLLSPSITYAENTHQSWSYHWPLIFANVLWQVANGLNDRTSDLAQSWYDGQVAAGSFQGGLCSCGGAWPPLTFSKRRRPAQPPQDTAAVSASAESEENAAKSFPTLEFWREEEDAWTKAVREDGCSRFVWNNSFRIIRRGRRGRGARRGNMSWRSVKATHTSALSGLSAHLQFKRTSTAPL